ncbi:MAG TPA: hypothetical protein VN800_04240 [Candidatus Acidoferrales bacterium]|nr:hypothetical protein [Candidatus Acidoferrales bacterium]
MARAKRTERAEARRRYRATQAEQAEQAAADDVRTASSAPAAPATSLAESARRAIGRMHRPDLRADLRAIPAVTRAQPLILLPYALLLVAAAAAVALPKGPVGGSSGLVSLYVQLAFLQPTLLFFAVGFLAPRGAYMFGAILGIMASVLFTVFALGLVGMFGSLDTMDATQRVVYSAWQTVQFVLTGAVFGWFAFWYRDFLRRSQARSREAAEARKRAQRREARRPEPKRAR